MKKACPAYHFALAIGLAIAIAAGSSAIASTSTYWLPAPSITPLYDTPYRISLFSPHNGEDGGRAWSQTKSTFVYGFGVIGVLVAMPEEMTGWEKDPDIFKKWVDNVTSGPEWDRNNWIYNYVGHTYFGGVYYQIARKSGYRQWDAFVYSFLMSTFYWEYGIEAFAEVPSIQDLAVTPVLGWVYGEWAYQTEYRIRNNDHEVLGSNLLGVVALCLLDPVDMLGSGINRITRRPLIKAGYGYFTYQPASTGDQTDHQIYLHMRFPVGGHRTTTFKTLKYIGQEYDPVDTGIIGLQLGTGYALHDKDRGMENGWYNKISLGLYFTPRSSLRLAYARGDVVEKATGQTITHENYSLDTQIYLNKSRRLRPHITAGLGELMWDQDQDRKTFQWNAGLGLHFRLHRKWALTADWINYYSPSDDTYDQQLNTGLVYRFGRGEHQGW